MLEKRLTNYWGYNTIGFFAPDPRYSAVPAFVFSEFKEMVARLHDAGLEVILDVVYNHTAEGNERGPTLSFRGIDNASYYRLLPDEKRYYINDTGTGNTLNLSNPNVLQMVTDSLRYWVNEMRVDGFRFDLGTILARQPDGFSSEHGFLQSCMQDPVLSQVKLIAEPWDIGPGGYQVGGFPPGWAEWNDKFRDTVRAFWKGDEGKLPELATRLAASADAFARRGRKPWSSVNFVTAHDGFTLNDLVSYNEKHNEANGENNQDGHSDNLSWNCGVEGPTDDPEIVALRNRQKRNLAGHTVAGARHAYASRRRRIRPHPTGQQQRLRAGQSDQLGRLEHPRGWRQALIEFVRKVIALRNALPILRRSRFLSGEYNADLDARDVRWLTPAATDMEAEHWQDGNARCLGMLMDGRAQATGIKRPSMDATVLLVLNAYHDVVKFKLPEVAGGQAWRCLLDTNVPDRSETPRFQTGDEYEITGRSLLLFALAARSHPLDPSVARASGLARNGRSPLASSYRGAACRMIASDPPKPPGRPPEEPDPDDPVPVEEPPRPIPVPPAEPPPEPLRA